MLQEKQTNQLNLESIKQAKDIETEKVLVPEWNGHVYIKILSGREREELNKRVEAKTVNGKLATEGLVNDFLSIVLCDEAGELLFSKENQDILSSKSGVVLNRLVEQAQKINGLTDESVDEKVGNF